MRRLTPDYHRSGIGQKLWQGGVFHFRRTVKQHGMRHTCFMHQCQEVLFGFGLSYDVFQIHVSIWLWLHGSHFVRRLRYKNGYLELHVSLIPGID